MDPDFAAAVLANDLDSMVFRIESLPGDVEYTNALNHITQARDAVRRGRANLHQRAMRQRHGG